MMFKLMLFSLLLHYAYPAALDDYVYRPDPYYKFEEIGKETGPGYTMYMINMTSQKWKTGIVNIFSVLLSDTRHTNEETIKFEKQTI